MIQEDHLVREVNQVDMAAQVSHKLAVLVY